MEPVDGILQHTGLTGQFLRKALIPRRFPYWTVLPVKSDVCFQKLKMLSFCFKEAVMIPLPDRWIHSVPHPHFLKRVDVLSAARLAFSTRLRVFSRGVGIWLPRAFAARLRTSSATTANPFPASPAWPPQQPRSGAVWLVWKEMSSMVFMMPLIWLEEPDMMFICF